MSNEAVKMARRLGGPTTLAYALDGRTAAILGPDTAEEQWAIQAEVRGHAELAGDLERLVQSHIYRLFELMARLRLDEFEAEYALAKKRVDELRQPAQRLMLGSIAAMHALLVGQFSVAERLIEQAYESGRDAAGWNADVSRRDCS